MRGGIVGWGIVLLGVVGCAIPEEDFPDRVADEVCDRVEECTEVFEDRSERMDCEDHWRHSAARRLEQGEREGLTYDPAAGANCVREVQIGTCAEFNDFGFVCDPFEDDASHRDESSGPVPWYGCDDDDDRRRDPRCDDD